MSIERWKERMTHGDVNAYLWDSILNFSNPTFTYFKGEFVDTDKFDIVPKKSWKEKQLQMKEEELRRLKESQKHYNQRAEELQKNCQSEIDKLKVELGS